MRAVLCTDRPLIRDVMAELLAEAGLDLMAHVPDELSLLISVGQLRPDVVFLAATDPSKEPGICSHLLIEFPRLKIVLLSGEQYAIADVGVRFRLYADLTIASISDSLRTLLSDEH